MVLQLDNANLKRQNLLANVLKLFLFAHEGAVVSMTNSKGFASKQKYHSHRTKRKCDTDSIMALFWKPNVQTPTKPNTVFIDRSLMLLTKDIC